MKIGIFCDTYSPSLNETSLIINELVREERKLGHKVYVITSSHSDVIDDENGVIRLEREVDIDEYNVSTKIKLSSSDKDKLDHLKVDVIHTFGVGNVAMLGKKIASKLNIPYVSTLLRDELVAKENKLKNSNKKVSSFKQKILKLKIDFLLKKSSCVMAFNSSTCKEYLNEIVKLGFDINKFNNSSNEEVEEKSRKLKVNNKNVYLMVTSFRKEYDNVSVINKFRDVISVDKKAILLIIGDGECKEEVNKAIIDNELTDKVILLDSISDSLDVYYRLAYAFIYNNDIPSTYLYLLIAMQEGVPVIAAYSQNLLDIVKDYKNGLFYHNIDELEDMVKTLLKDGEVKEKLISYKNEAIKEYSASVYAKNMESIYLKSIRNKNSQRKDDKYKNRKIRRKYENKK